jgi:hypothetical protein
MQEKLGPWSKYVILPLQSASEKSYYVFMRPLDPSSSKQGALAFTNTDDSCPMATLSEDKNGNLVGDCPAFLYMSMASFAAGDIKSASRFLDLMQGEKTPVGDKKQLKVLAQQLKNIPVTTDKAAAFLLKAELIVQGKLQEKLSPAETSRIFTLAGMYQAAKNNIEKQQRNVKPKARSV